MLQRDQIAFRAPASSETSTPNLPIVFASGLACDERLWDKVLAGRDRQSCVVDFRNESTIAAMADAILKVQTPRFLLAGFSMGGMAALIAASNAADRVAGLLVMGTHGEFDTPERLAARRRQVAQADAGSFAAFVRHTLVPSYGRDEREGDADDLCIADMALALGPDVFRRHVQGLIARPDIAAIASWVRVPVIVLNGAHDTLSPPAWGARLAARVPGAAFEVVPDCGHMLPLECPSAVVTALDRLERIATKGFVA